MFKLYRGGIMRLVGVVEESRKEGWEQLDLGDVNS